MSEQRETTACPKCGDVLTWFGYPGNWKNQHECGTLVSNPNYQGDRCKVRELTATVAKLQAECDRLRAQNVEIAKSHQNLQYACDIFEKNSEGAMELEQELAALRKSHAAAVEAEGKPKSIDDLPDECPACIGFDLPHTCNR